MSLSLIFSISLGSIKFVEGGGYSYPQPPIQFDELATPPVYLPPPFHDDVPQIIPAYPPIGAPPEGVLPPVDDSVVIPAPPNNQYLPQPQQAPIQILNMSCLESRDGSGYFRVVFRGNSDKREFPVMERGGNCVVVPVGTDGFKIELEGSRMANCGIRSCGGRMCLGLRMAMIPGLRLAEDPLVTLQCIPQEAVVSHTKHIRLNTHNEQGRSNTKSIPVTSGGVQRRFESVITLLRRNNGIFDQTLQQGGSVHLGDELLLRTSVRDGDGWKSSRMGSVIIRSASSQKSVILVDEEGCRNPSVRTICPQQPQKIAPLTVELPFRAFLFQGAAPADDLLLSVRMSACLRPRDCLNRLCEENSKPRSSRAAGNFSEDLVTDLESQFQFRVLPKSLEPTRNNSGTVIIFLIILSILFCCCIIVLIFRPLKKRIYL